MEGGVRVPSISESQVSWCGVKLAPELLLSVDSGVGGAPGSFQYVDSCVKLAPESFPHLATGVG